MSQRGKVKTQCRRGNVWPATPEQIKLHAMLMAWPVERLQSLIARTGVRSNVRARI